MTWDPITVPVKAQAQLASRTVVRGVAEPSQAPVESGPGREGTRKRAVFLDRDGVLNELVARSPKAGPPWSLAEFRLMPRVQEACRQLRQEGWQLIVVTNQPDVARGQLSREVLTQINQKLQAELGLHAIFVCMHDDRDACSCRKPKPGLLLQAAESWRLDLRRSWMVGDQHRDIQAGQAAGCRTLLVGPRGLISGLFDAAAIITSSPSNHN